MILYDKIGTIMGAQKKCTFILKIENGAKSVFRCYSNYSKTILKSWR